MFCNVICCNLRFIVGHDAISVSVDVWGMSALGPLNRATRKRAFLEKSGVYSKCAFKNRWRSPFLCGWWIDIFVLVRELITPSVMNCCTVVSRLWNASLIDELSGITVHRDHASKFLNSLSSSSHDSIQISFRWQAGWFGGTTTQQTFWSTVVPVE